MAVYDHQKIEKKWQKRWEDAGIYQPDFRHAKKPFYNLMMFPYPSAEGLHVGNMYAFTGADVYGRFQRMQGKDVFEPIGLDGFGIHSENYAISIGKHPAEQAKISQKRFYKQLSEIGNGFAWDNRLETYDPDYYRWTQWLFIKMFKHGLAYRKKASVNWCPSCKTVLADEQVEGGVCERCKTPTTRKQTEQWFFKITEYVDRLLRNIDGTRNKKQEARNNEKFGPVEEGYDVCKYGLRWPEKIKTAQRNWIGHSEGAEIGWRVEGSRQVIWTFTTRLDTVYGATFLVLAPEYPLVEKILHGEFKLSNKKVKEVEEYVRAALKKTEQKRKAAEKEKTGVDTDLKVLHPLTRKKIPIWVADFVLMEYGTGVVMGVPGHDQRDHDFVRQHNLPIVKVIDVDGKDVAEQAVEEYGVLVNSGEFDGLTSEQAMKEMLKKLEKMGLGRAQVSYHLRDWLISRQRYWGPPIPMIHCKTCGWQSVQEEELPVVLPNVKDYQPMGDGRSPLEKAPESWFYTKCPRCGKKAKRETDVSDTFLDSSWYFLAYSNSRTREWKSKKAPFNEAITKKWLPVDAYIGGAEHAVLHLLYSRFITMALHDWGYLQFEEPFPFLYSHGLIIRDGAKMSKSRGNVIIPDDYIKKFGSDTLRTCLMFLGPYDRGGDFRDTGIAGIYRFLNRVWRLFQVSQESTPKGGQAKVPLTKLRAGKSQKSSRKMGEETDEVLIGSLHRTIKKVTRDLERFRFNTAIAAMMEFVNAWEQGGQLSSKDAGIFLKLIGPFAPHVAEELYQNLQISPKKGFESIHIQPWPSYDESLVQEEEAEIIVQVNGKLRGIVIVPSDVATDKAKVTKLAREQPAVAKYLKGVKVRKTVWVEGKLVNFVTA